MKNRILWLFLFLFTLSGVNSSMASSPKNVILFMIDGLHWQAPDKLKMPNFNALIEKGTYIEKSYVLLPHHPTVGDYGKYNSCSFPNPVLHSGTIFIKPENKLLQESLPANLTTAFVVNTPAYRTVARGFSTSIMDANLSDEQVVDNAINIFENQSPAFMRVHLQTPGELGRSVNSATPEQGYFRDIFGQGSPYVAGVENADKLLGKFVRYLKKSGNWEDTVLIVSSDHGQSKIGWHPMFDEDSWVTPMVFAGKGIARQRSLPYFEHTDLAATISMLLNSKAPSNNGGAGRIVKEILANTKAKDFHHDKFIKTINQQIKQFNFYKSELLLDSDEKPHYAVILASLENEFLTPEPFYHQDRITDWHKAGTTKHMILANEKILKQMKTALGK
ncbi:sulfatase-like hydrolase/transferase [Thalassotalea fonticola]|uniref:Sulfatase-like hydrolase/transferase n=1 Tax=Thalassotalea fonticola TaxID=3065649 RepID=A0ABZ0GIG1_9GAMM|nr:sulfatase-like hydrolase/transferase [Colwelliaceae bacterium S1-1]